MAQLTDPRPTLTSYARSLAGLSAAGPTRAAYLELIAPGETPARAVEMALMSGCALTCRAVLRHFIDHPILAARYRTGDAVADLVHIGREAGALRPLGAEPEAGDIVVVGGGTDGGGTEHAWTVLEVRRVGYEPAVCIVGLDGGQRAAELGADGKGAQCIRIRERLWRDGMDVVEGGSARKVRFVINAALVLARFGSSPDLQESPPS
jgi:hypothetical protein